jgi:translation initiation factor 3 subunit G
MSKTQLRSRTDWAEDEDDDSSLALPAPQVTKNKDGTETVVSWRINEQGQKVKITRKIRKTVREHVVNHRVAERRQWSKFGAEAGKPAGPSSETTTLGEAIEIRFNVPSKKNENEEEEAGPASLSSRKTLAKDASIKCRICGGEHWTSKCPYKDTMAPEGEPGPGLDDDEGSGVGGGGGGGSVGGAYVPPALRGKNPAGERMSGGGGKFERDDLATLRVTNLSESADEGELRELFGRWGHVVRVFLAKDRDTGRAKGFAFISYSDRAEAARACEKMDGCKCLLHPRNFTDIDRWLPIPNFTCGVCQKGYLEAICRIGYIRRVMRNHSYSLISYSNVFNQTTAELKMHVPVVKRKSCRISQLHQFL